MENTLEAEGEAEEGVLGVLHVLRNACLRFSLVSGLAQLLSSFSLL
jgi:hypothetical protein